MPKKAQSKLTPQPFQLPGGKLNSYLGKLYDFKSSKKVYLIILIALILVLAVYKKSWFIAATVNGMPITNLELQTKLNAQFRTQTLNQMVNEKIILDEAHKRNALPQKQEIDAKIAELEKNVGGKDTLDSLLSQQGQTRDTLNEQITVQLAITKMYQKEATVSADEVNKYIDTNKDQLKATDSAKQQEEAASILQQQKLSQIFSQKFQELRQQAKIQIY